MAGQNVPGRTEERLAGQNVPGRAEERLAGQNISGRTGTDFTETQEGTTEDA